MNISDLSIILKKTELADESSLIDSKSNGLLRSVDISGKDFSEEHFPTRSMSGRGLNAFSLLRDVPGSDDDRWMSKLESHCTLQDINIYGKGLLSDFVDLFTDVHAPVRNVNRAARAVATVAEVTTSLVMSLTVDPVLGSIMEMSRNDRLESEPGAIQGTVPDIRQIGKWDCGPTSVAMLLEYALSRSIGRRQVADRVGEKQGVVDAGTRPSVLRDVMNDYLRGGDKTAKLGVNIGLGDSETFAEKYSSYLFNQSRLFGWSLCCCD